MQKTQSSNRTNQVKKIYNNSIRKGTKRLRENILDKLLGKAQSRQRENILSKKNRQSIRKGIMQLIHNTITILTTKNYREKHNTITIYNDY